MVVVDTTTGLAIAFDPAKRSATLAERGLDFADALVVFAGVTIEFEDTRREYGEKRFVCYGLLAGRMVVLAYTLRGTVRQVLSMRKSQ